MIEVYKFLHDLYTVDRGILKMANSSSITRGHNVKLSRLTCRSRIRHDYFSQRIVEYWNGLPSDVAMLHQWTASKVALTSIGRSLCSLCTLLQWSKDWQMLFKIDKCKVMHFGRNNLMIYFSWWTISHWVWSKKRRIWALWYHIIWRHQHNAYRRILKRTGCLGSSTVRLFSSLPVPCSVISVNGNWNRNGNYLFPFREIGMRNWEVEIILRMGIE